MSLSLILSYFEMINWHTIAFYIISIFLISSAVYVVLTGNIVRSVIALIFTFLMTAGIYFLLQAEFIAVVQMLIYAGAISVLIVFSVMLITDRDKNINETSPFSHNLFFGSIASGLFYLAVSITVHNTSWNVTLKNKEFTDISLIARGFLTENVIAFELAAVLLLVALAAAIFIIKEVKDDN
ncbi:MAG: NADH-quinone oxidoreductase subunit J [Eubacteriales bacterium]|nr:NADH-quinone oxidoreductase subunit J [Eubacteriales bacterium]NCC80764.1 hypothetical protein [Clostridia bacterium]